MIGVDSLLCDHSCRPRFAPSSSATATPDVDVATYTGLSAKQLRDAHAVVVAHIEEIHDAFGTVISAAEVTHVSRHGLWVRLGQEELLVPFVQFPWFKKATIEQLSNVEWPSADHLYWPQLDVDLSIASIRDPAAFPLVSRENA